MAGTAKSPAEALTELTEEVRSLRSGQQSMQVELSAVREKMTATASTSQHSGPPSQKIESVEKRLREIELTLGEFAQTLDGEKLKDASQTLVAEAQRNARVLTSASETAEKVAQDTHTLTVRLDNDRRAISQAAQQEIRKVATEVSKSTTAATSGRLDAIEEGADRIIEKVERVEGRQLWSAVAAMFFAFMPVAVVIAGVVSMMFTLISGWQWATAVDWDPAEGEPLLGVGRVLAVLLGSGAVLAGLFYAARWAASLVETWRGRDAPKWPSWRR